MNEDRFEEALYAVSDNISNILRKLSPIVKSNTEEIRLRVNLPISLTVEGETVFIRKDSKTTFCYEEALVYADESDIKESFKKICSNSVYAHEKELENGFVIMKNGCRAGVFGTLLSNGCMKNISSLNIRIAKEIKGAANDIIKRRLFGGVLIAGPPGSGKTTVLRDLIRQTSNGRLGKFMRIAVIDSRGEISGGGTKNAFDLGINTDILYADDKAHGAEIAVRTMFPDILAFDEISTERELKAVSESFHSGVEVYTTAHIGSISELKERTVTKELLKSGVIKNVALLPSLHGGDIKLLRAKELSIELAV